MGKRREASRPELMELSEWRTWETLAAIRIASARFVSQSHDFQLSVALTATFKFQDTGSFVGALYGGSNTITVKGNMLYVDLSSFKSTVEVSNYRVWLYQSGIRPSATIGLGCVGSSLADPRYNKQANWNPDGSITLLGGAGRENILMQRFSMPIPSGVTFS